MPYLFVRSYELDLKYVWDIKWHIILCRMLYIHAKSVHALSLVRKWVNGIIMIQISLASTSFSVTNLNQTYIWVDFYHLRCNHSGPLDDTVNFSCLVSNAYFSCIGQDSLYHNMGIGTMWHCALVSCTPSQSMGLVLGVRCSGCACHYVFLPLIPWYGSISSWLLWLFGDLYRHHFYFELHV